MKLLSQNKKAYRDYEVLETLEAGVVLKGSEVKAVRQGGVNLTDGFVRIIRDEVYLFGCHISPYSHSRTDSHDPVREKKLLLHRKEIDKLSSKIGAKGLTAVPTKFYFKDGRCKVEIALGKGKKSHDKREDIKKRDAERDMKRFMKVKNR